jgi:hypothetical protein
MKSSHDVIKDGNIFFKYKSVSDPEMDKLLKRPKMRNLFKLLKAYSKQVPGAPPYWLVTSIDRSRNGTMRVTRWKPGNHYDSRAVDVVPLNNQKRISLPIPLNRNLIIMRSLKILGHKMFPHVQRDLPIVAFEADHIHTDVNNTGGFKQYNVTRPFLDGPHHRAAQSSPILKEALDSGKLLGID